MASWAQPEVTITKLPLSLCDNAFSVKNTYKKGVNFIYGTQLIVNNDGTNKHYSTLCLYWPHFEFF